MSDRFVPPRALPLLGHALELRRGALSFYERLARSAGPVARLRLGPLTLSLVSGAREIGEVLLNDVDGWEKGIGNAALRPLVGQGLFLAEGDAWKRKRKALRPLFTREHTDEKSPIVREETFKMLERWKAFASSGQRFDLHAEVRRVTLAIASRAIVGTDLFATRPELGDALERMWGRLRFLLGSGGPWALRLPLAGNRRFHSDRALVDDALRAAIAAHRHGSGGAPPLDLMRVLDAEDLHDEMMTFLLTGQECSSIAVAWSAVLLAKHASVQDGLLAGDDVAKPLVRQVVREAMRLFPPAWMMARTATREQNVGGVKIPAGTVVLLCTWNLHRDPTLWPDPLRFDPSRFAPDAPKPPRHAYLPFGVGPRTCIGMQLALMQSETLVLEMHRRYRIAIEDVPEPDPGMTLRPRGGVPVRVVERG